MRKIKIAIVDDSPFSISIIKDILLEKGYDVVGEAGSLEETIKVVKDTKPDMVTMDMTIPGTDGLECTRAIHSIDPNIKVLVISSMMDEEIVKKARENKVSGYIQKPVDPEELTTAIERIISGEELFNELKEIYFNVFKEAFLDNMNRLTKTVPKCLEEKVTKENHHSRGVSIVVGIIGKFSGSMILDASYETVENIAKHVLKRDIKSREEALAVMGEFSNIVSGNACSILNRKNKVFGFRVAPPSIFHGNSLNISRTIVESKEVVSETIFGQVYLNVGFKRGEGEWM
ncbi:chemotaxis protein CheY [Clostridium homopropionicum DSM 5847]|uniref:Stage 0 sporulation protein A homolog n=1 Tax=Clostridium homopropionicum DSM 5847 TaxID=1121318 RepID=A0A0L6Z6W8_9CLOT|nr:response regulator [Clostridium homopropionicum]KOA18583.1 chemotaxis protein CheY [Clostridium homopropionicum DSM 5847]SFG48954.1 Chemotaxis phosphatase CheX [Clostridium homopropionicum]